MPTGIGTGGLIIVNPCPTTGSIASHTVPFPAELAADTIKSIELDGFGATNNYTWQYSNNGSTWTTAPGNVTTAYYPLPAPNNPPNIAYYRRLTMTGCASASNVATITTFSAANGLLKGTINGRVTSVNGTGVADITITAKKTVNLLGSPVTKTYTTITNPSGNYSLQNVFYGEPSEGDTAIVDFVVTPSRGIHEFNPVRLTASLSKTNFTANSIDFVDNTVYSVTGKVTQTCIGCEVGFSTDALDSVRVNAIKTAGNLSAGQAFTGSNGYGSFGITLTDPGTYRFVPTRPYHSFSPVDTTITIVNNDLLDVNFRDNSYHIISGIFKAGCDQNIGTAQLEFTDTVPGTAVPKFKKLVTTAADGSYSVSLPARKYKVRFVSFIANTAGDDIAVDSLLKFFNVIIKDSSIRDIDSVNQTLNFIYHRAPVLQLVNFNDTTCGNFVVMRQNKPKTFIVNIFEGNPALGCKIATDTNSINIITSVQSNDENQTLLFNQVNGSDTITLMGGSPNIAAPPLPALPYLKYFNLTYKDKYGRPAADISKNVVVLGVKTDPGTFTTVSPQIPMMILHDPPGDASFSFWEANKTQETAMRFYTANSNSNGGWLEVKLGVKFILGFGFSTETSIWGSINAGQTTSARVNESNEAIISTTNTQYYSTADNSSIIGDAGDVYIGAALNLLYAKGYELKYSNGCTLGVENKLAIADSGFATTYVYTESHITGSIIPTLQLFANSAADTARRDSILNQIKVWQQVIRNNTENKARATIDDQFPNISFNGAAGPITHSTTTSSTKTSTIEFDMEIDRNLAVELGLEIGGSGVKGGFNVGFKVETGESKTQTTTNSTTMGYTLDDDDDEDNFSVNIKRDPVYNTPVFALVAGQASCPAEPVAQKRDACQLLIPQPTISNIPANEEALFTLQLTNTSESSQERTYLLNFAQGSNPYGATVTVGGIPINNLSYTIAAGQTQIITVSVRKSQASPVFSYEGLRFEVTDACAGGGDILKTNFITANFVSSCSNINLASPLKNWIFNRSSGNSLPITFDGYTIPNLQSVTLEHTNAGSATWVTDTIINQVGITSATATTINWNAGNITDGAYDLRLKLQCANGTIFSQRITGVIDRSFPTLYGIPEPTDDDFVVGDLMAFTYNENLDTLNNNVQVELLRMSNNTVIPVQVSTYQNRIVILPASPISGFIGETMRLVVTNIADRNGNVKPTGDTSYFIIGTSIAATGAKAVTLSSLKPGVFENSNDSMDIRFNLPAAAQRNTTINYAITGTATYGSDYTVRYPAGQPITTSFNGIQGVITILEGATQAILRIKPIGDFVHEADETITVTLLEGGDYLLGAVISKSDTIKNDDHSAPVIITICNGSSLLLSTSDSIDGQQIYSYRWSNGSTNPTLTVTASGTYTLTVYTIDGSAGISKPFVANIADLNPPSLGADTVLLKDCLGEMTNLLTVFNTTDLISTWNNATPMAVPPGTYRLVVANQAGCTDTAFVQIKLEVATWTGAVSSNWHTAANWNINKVPTEKTHVIINSGTPNNCIISSINAVAASVQLRNGATVLALANMPLTINGRCSVLPLN